MYTLVLKQTMLGWPAIYSLVANFVQCVSVKNYINWFRVDNSYYDNKMVVVFRTTVISVRS